MEAPVTHNESPEASWFLNVAQFPFVDPTSGVRFEPRTPVRTVLTDWMKSQPTIEAYKFHEGEKEVPKPEELPDLPTA